MSHRFAFYASYAFVALLCLSALTCGAATLRVPSQYPTIQGAIDAARSGDTVLVASGTYIESLTIRDKGIFTLEGEVSAQNTIVDAGGASSVIEMSASRNSDSNEYRIARFTVRNGRDCGIHGHRVRSHIEHDILIGNGLDDEGHNCGAIHLEDGSGSIWGSVIEGNHGTGVRLIDPHQVIVESNRIQENAGGGIELPGPHVPDASATLIRNIVKGNGRSDMRVSGPVDLLAVDNLFVRSRTLDTESVYVEGDPDGHGPITGQFVNNTFAGTTGTEALVSFINNVEGIELANNIFYSKSEAPALICYTLGDDGGVPALHYNDAFSKSGQAVQGTCASAYASGVGNLSVDPEFTGGRDRHTWQPSPSSPVIDRGNNDLIGNLHRDLRGAPRILDGGHGALVDMGAYEYRSK